MRNVMQEQDVTDWKARLAAYVPETEQERRDRNEISLRRNNTAHSCSGAATQKATLPVPDSSWTPGWKRC